VIPAAGQLEAAGDELLTIPDQQREDQLRELAAFGSARAHSIGATGLSTDFEVGYELGLQVARVILRLEPQLIEKGIDASTLL
jgi:hypothetical protein